MDKYNQLLGEILSAQHIPVMEERFYSLTPQKIRSHNYNNIVHSLYNALEGCGEKYPIDLPEKGLQVNGVYVIFDDTIHFNRYRKITLRSDLYQNFNGFNVSNYRRYCRNFEKECLKAGTRIDLWTDHTSEEYFGQAGNPGEFLDNGPPKWKMQAFQDFLLDLNCTIHGQKFRRIAYYDNILIDGKLVQIGKLLSLWREKYATPLVNYILRVIAS